jgi:flagellar hook capping protein FlgD
MVLLLAGTAGAIVLTQHLRDEGPVASNIFFKKRPHGRYRVCFALTRHDTVTVELVNNAGQVARVLASGAALQSGTAKSDAHCYDWDGTDAAGHRVPAGPYHLRLHLEQAGRTATSGEHAIIPAARGGTP